MKPEFVAAVLLGGFVVVANFPARGAAAVDVKEKPEDAGWKSFPTRTLADLPPGATNRLASGLSQYGGLLARKVKATGFFHTANLDGRWWLVDPEGCLYLQRGVNAVSMLAGPDSQGPFREKFGSASNWVTETSAFLRAEGFTAAGAWSDVERLRQTTRPLVHARILNFMGGYGQKRGGTYQQSGHLGYPHDCIFVFDPAFETYCDTQARQLEQYKNDPWLLGYFSDNELPFRREALKNYLQFPEADPGHQAALKWLQARHGRSATVKDVTARDEQDFLGVVAGRYFRIVSTAIKKHDPNHLFIGSRINGRALNYTEIFKAAGPYLDVVSVNYYREWTPSQDKLSLWSRETGKPILVTEWYAKAMDSGMANTGGAGWVVKTQRDRGLFYQNFTLGLLESKSCVGWDWFKYSDNDPTNLKADPSNRDSNKGIINIRYEFYRPLVELMKPLNDNAYSLVDYFDKSALQAVGGADGR